jgi:hypothetical protein
LTSLSPSRCSTSYNFSTPHKHQIHFYAQNITFLRIESQLANTSTQCLEPRLISFLLPRGSAFLVFQHPISPESDFVPEKSTFIHRPQAPSYFKLVAWSCSHHLRESLTLGDHLGFQALEELELSSTLLARFFAGYQQYLPARPDPST